MIQKHVYWFVPAVVLLAFPAIGSAANAAKILSAAQQAMGGTMPKTLQIGAAGSAYSYDNGTSSRHRYRIEDYSQQLDLRVPSDYEQQTRVADAADGNETRKTQTRVASATQPWPRQYALWTTPYGFLKGAMSHAASVEPKTVLGTKYLVVSFTPKQGEEIRGFVNDRNLLGMTQTQFKDPVLGDVQFETTYQDWTNFGGMKYPGIIIDRMNGRISRILVVNKVKSGIRITVSQASG